ncbi:MAG: SH3 domain-containing protein, partial [Chloroflexota bacterium]
QDWAAIGQSADIVYAQMPLDPTAYTAGGTADSLLNWAIRQVNRSKLVMMVDASAVDRLGESFTALSNDAALANFGELQFLQGGEQVGANESIEVVLSGNATPLEWDGSSLTYKYSYDDAGQNHNVWLSNPAALAQRLGVSRSYNLRGVSVRGLGELEDGPGYGAALASATGQTAAPEATGAAIVWTIRDPQGSVVASESGSDFSFAWGGGTDGNYELSAEFALGNTIATLDSTSIAIGDAPVVAEETTEETTEAEEETAVAETDTSEETAPEPTPEPEAEPEPEPTAAPPPANLDPGSEDAVVNTNANVRTGPGLSFGTIAGGANAGTSVSLIGRTSDNSWYQIVLPDGQEGWIFGTLLNVNSGVDLGGLEVVEVTPPPGGGGGGAPAPPPAPISGAFELGGQTAGLPVGPMQISGMTWIKRQHKWSPGNTGNDVQGLITEGHNAGFKVLLSIPGQLNPSSIDFASYVVFLGQVAALSDPPDAIEVWNEMNITREWPAGQINPTSYVNDMLIPAYTAIKAANPNILVITGAPAPTGFFGGSCGGNGCDDAPYIAGMMAAGAGSYSDCVGVHYNEGIVPPSWTSGDPRGSGGHYTRYYQGMVDAYVAAGARSLCFTEIGYLSGEEWGFVPGGFLWKAPFNLTVAEHAQYLAEAVSLAANSGIVRLFIIFNVDFTTWNDDPQAGYAMIRPNGGCPACETVGNVMRGQ